MPLAKKTTSSVLPAELQNQIANNFKKDDEPSVTPVQPQVQHAEPVSVPAQPAAETASSPKSKYSDSVNLRLTSGKRNDFKKFFTDCEISMNQGFEMAVDYIMREQRAGRITVSKSGITKVGE